MLLRQFVIHTKEKRKNWPSTLKQIQKSVPVDSKFKCER